MELVDARKTLPRHATKTWARRPLSAIKGVVFHQALGVKTALGCAQYHVGSNHIAADGMPGLAYIMFVEADGKVYQANDFEDITWSQGGSTKPPLHSTKGNTNYLAVCFGGDFPGKQHKGVADPTPAQLRTARELWTHLATKFGLHQDRLFGHYHFGKPACPGTALQNLIIEIREKGLELAGKDTKMWQTRLAALDYDVTADGKWGPMSKAALSAFQTSAGLVADGERGPLGDVSLALRAQAVG